MLRTILCIIFCFMFFGCEKPKNLSSPSETADVVTEVANDTASHIETTNDRTPIDVPDSKVFDSLEADMIPTGMAPGHKSCFNADVPLEGEGFSLINCKNGCCVFSIETKDSRDSGCYEEWCASFKPCTWLAYKKPWCEKG
jgi:hypothetical protein